MKFYFTFGGGQPYQGCYHVIEAETGNLAREIMFERFGKYWSMQYLTAETAGVEKYHYKLLPWPVPPDMYQQNTEEKAQRKLVVALQAKQGALKQLAVQIRGIAVSTETYLQPFDDFILTVVEGLTQRIKNAQSQFTFKEEQEQGKYDERALDPDSTHKTIDNQGMKP